MIGIIGALEIEINGLKELLKESSVKKVGNFNFYTGRINQKEIVLLKCGVGKVNAAAATAVLLSAFDVDEVINIGIAGGVNNTTKALDIVVSDKVVQHDFDCTALGYELGQTEDNKNGYYSCSCRLTKAFSEIAAKRARCFAGTIATGDKFVASDIDAKTLETVFGAVACDMESAAIEQVTRLFNKEFIALRTVSDKADNNAAFDFAEFEKAAAAVSIEIIKDYLL